MGLNDTHENRNESSSSDMTVIITLLKSMHRLRKSGYSTWNIFVMSSFVEVRVTVTEKSVKIVTANQISGLQSLLTDQP